MNRDKYSHAEFTNFRRRVQVLGILVVLVFVALLFRLWQVQVLRGQAFRELSENNRLRQVRLASRRGGIFDRNGVALATTRPAFNLSVVRQDLGDLEQTIFVLSQRLDLDRAWLRRKIETAPPFMPILIRRDLNRRDVAFFEEQKFDLPGVLLEVEPIRHYLYGPQLAHVLGYVGEVTEQQLAQDRAGERLYRPGDLIGKTGVELVYDRELRGKNGYKEMEVDAHGQEVRGIRRVPSTPGNDLYLTIDWRLQQLAANLLGSQAGAVVALDPRNGEVLALVSQPAYDPNQFVSGLSPAMWQALQQDPKNPLQNRALQGQYPPGSVYKIIVAVAALEEKAITPQEELFCPGFYSFGDRIYHDWKKGGHGYLSLRRALSESCDVYFYQLGQRLGVDAIAKYAQGFGLGRPTGIALPNEKGGLIPTTRWKERVLGQPWYPGETIPIAIGQGYNLVTPIQQAELISAVANGGTLYQPYVLKRITSGLGAATPRTLRTGSPQIVGYLPAQPENLARVRQGLRDVVNAAHGTGWRAKLRNVVVAGKTGTSQVISLSPEYKDKQPAEIPERFRDHSWFVAFAPFDEPTIAVAIFAEHSGKGGSQFAPIARQLIAAHLGVDVQVAERQARTFSEASRLQLSGGAPE